ncbi:MAG: hypothetical protein Q4D19_12075 [Lautropia sp.]|nr:hypothetical protein [Lautropia sp.]
MSRFSGFSRLALSVSIASLLAACGGGGGGPSLPESPAAAAGAIAGGATVNPAPVIPGSGTPVVPENPNGGAAINQPPVSGLPPGVNQQAGGDVHPVDQNSFWTVDQYRYVAGGHTAVSDSKLDGYPFTVWNTSTFNYDGGTDTRHANGAFSGSTVQFLFSGNEGGIFDVAPNMNAFVTAVTAGAKVVLVEVYLGTSAPGLGTTAGTALYYASSGQVQISKSADGKFRFDSVGSLPIAKAIEALGGIAGGSPEQMTLTLNNVH